MLLFCGLTVLVWVSGFFAGRMSKEANAELEYYRGWNEAFDRVEQIKADSDQRFDIFQQEVFQTLKKQGIEFERVVS